MVHVTAAAPSTYTAALLHRLSATSRTASTLRYLDIELELPLADNESVSSVQVLLLFDYQLNDMVEVHMESAAFFEFTGAGSGSELSVDGPLVFKQLDPLAWNGERYQYNQPVVNSSSYAPADYDFATILQNYEDRNGNMAVRCPHVMHPFCTKRSPSWVLACAAGHSTWLPGGPY